MSPRKKKNKTTIQQLLPCEDGTAHITEAWHITTITWFRLDDNNTTLDKVGNALQTRVQDLLAANPWLAGKLKLQLCGSLLPRHVLVHPAEILPNSKYLSRHFRLERSQSPLTCPTNNENNAQWQDLDPNDLSRSCHDAGYFASTKSCLWKVTLVPCRDKPNERFGVVHSLCHAIADGHTYYKLHNYLLAPQASTPAPALNPERYQPTLQQQQQAMGRTEAGLALSFGFMWAGAHYMVMSKVKEKLRLGQRHCKRQQFGWVNPNHVARVKRQHSVLQDENNESNSNDNDMAAPFVSTNDIVTSWFFRHANCSHGLMAINWRHKLTGHEDNMAGNYENALLYYPPDFESPQRIRKSLSSSNDGMYKRAVTRDTTKSPSFLKHWQGTHAVITNWGSFVDNTAFGIAGCSVRELVHIPIMPKYTASNHLVFAVLFRPSLGRLGMLFLAQSNDALEKFMAVALQEEEGLLL